MKKIPSKTSAPPPLVKEADENRFDQIRKAAAERHLRNDTDGTRRRARQTVENNRII